MQGREPISDVFTEATKINSMAPPDTKPSATLGVAEDGTETPVGQQTMTGFPLYAVLVGICVGSFLMSVDVFIISTVSRASLTTPNRRPPLSHPEHTTDTTPRPSPPS